MFKINLFLKIATINPWADKLRQQKLKSESGKPANKKSSRWPENNYIVSPRHTVHVDTQAHSQFWQWKKALLIVVPGIWA